MAVDQQISVAGTAAAPLSYTVPNTVEAALLCVNATIDGTGASGSFLPTVEIVSDGGVIVARCPCLTTIVAGASAEVSWFRLRNPTPTDSSTTSPYENLILSTGGLVLYWKLDDAVGSTTVADSKGTNPGNVVGTLTFGQTKLADITSCLFSAGYAGLKTDVPGIQGNNLMSVIVWVKTTAVAAQNTIAWSDTSSPDGRYFQLYTNALGHVVAAVFGTDATGHTFSGTVAVNDGIKHSIGVVYSATTPSTGAGAVGSIYVDGVLDTATPLAMGGFPLANRNHALVIGAEWRNAFDDPIGGNRLVGTLDEFALFTSSLTATQVAHIDAAGRVV